MIPRDNQKSVIIDTKLFADAVDRVATNFGRKVPLC